MPCCGHSTVWKARHGCQPGEVEQFPATTFLACPAGREGLSEAAWSECWVSSSLLHGHDVKEAACLRQCRSVQPFEHLVPLSAALRRWDRRRHLERLVSGTGRMSVWASRPPRRPLRVSQLKPSCSGTADWSKGSTRRAGLRPA